MSGYCLTIGDKQDDGTYLAIISWGSPQRGDQDVTVLSMERVRSHQTAKKWFRRMLEEKPWEARH